MDKVEKKLIAAMTLATLGMVITIVRILVDVIWG
jgi:hypothetical protein